MIFESTNATWLPNTDVANPYSPVGSGYSGDNEPNGATGARYATGYLASTNATAPFPTTTFDAPTGRHLDTSNFLFVDGHVKSLRGETVSAGFAAATPTTVASGPSGNYNAAGTDVPGFAGTFSPI